MDNNKIAKELVAIARELTAESVRDFEKAHIEYKPFMSDRLAEIVEELAPYAYKSGLPLTNWRGFIWHKIAKDNQWRDVKAYKRMLRKWINEFVD